jgi:paraquat-inducible protein B
MSAGEHIAAPRRTVSETHRSWWPGWIWGIPVAAIAIVVWLLVQALSSRGVRVTVVFDDAAGMKPGDTKVLYRGLNVGEVRSVELESDGLHVIARLDMDRDIERFLNAGTRFYLQGVEPSLSDLASLKAIIAGPTIVLAPGPGAPARHFFGHVGKPPQRFQVRLPYRTVFAGDAGDLKPGVPVKIDGFTVGEVADVHLSVDPRTGALTAPAILMLDPTRFHIEGADPAKDGWRVVLNAALAELVQRGLRARLSRAPPMVGAHEVLLEIEPHAAAASLHMQGVYPEIPASTAAGLEGVLTQAGELPLEEIGNNVRAVTARLEALVSSKELSDSIVHLDSTLAELDHTIHAIGPRLTPTIDSAQAAVDGLRKAALQIDATAAVAKRTIGSNGAQQGENVQDALRELTEAARAARSLADELEQHPESLIRGRR